MSIREMVDVELRKGMGPVTRTLYRQLSGFDTIERAATELGYELQFDPKVPMVDIYRKRQHSVFPWYVSDRFSIIPKRPYWVEESGLIEARNGILMQLPSTVEGEVIDVLAEQHREEIRLSVNYSHKEDDQEAGTWNGEVHSVQELNDLLINPPKV